MKYDLIQSGRRPNTLCGAAIIIAGLGLNIKLDLKEVAQKVNKRERVSSCMVTLKERIKEFAQSNGSKITCEEFL